MISKKISFSQDLKSKVIPNFFLGQLRQWTHYTHLHFSRINLALLSLLSFGTSLAALLLHCLIKT